MVPHGVWRMRHIEQAACRMYSLKTAFLTTASFYTFVLPTDANLIKEKFRMKSMSGFPIKEIFFFMNRSTFETAFIIQNQWPIFNISMMSAVIAVPDIRSTCPWTKQLPRRCINKYIIFVKDAKISYMEYDIVGSSS